MGAWAVYGCIAIEHSQGPRDDLFHMRLHFYNGDFESPSMKERIS